MTKTLLQIENIEAGELFTRLDRMENAISALTNTPQQAVSSSATEYITRREVAKLLKISLVTVHDWTSKGILTAYKCGKRIYFKYSEVEAALIKKGGIYAHR